jgi:hypothetical protein
MDAVALGLRGLRVVEVAAPHDAVGAVLADDAVPDVVEDLQVGEHHAVVPGAADVEVLAEGAVLRVLPQLPADDRPASGAVGEPDAVADVRLGVDADQAPVTAARVVGAEAVAAVAPRVDVRPDRRRRLDEDAVAVAGADPDVRRLHVGSVHTLDVDAVAVAAADLDVGQPRGVRLRAGGALVDDPVLERPADDEVLDGRAGLGDPKARTGRVVLAVAVKADIADRPVEPGDGQQVGVRAVRQAQQRRVRAGAAQDAADARVPAGDRAGALGEGERRERDEVAGQDHLGRDAGRQGGDGVGDEVAVGRAGVGGPDAELVGVHDGGVAVDRQHRASPAGDDDLLAPVAVEDRPDPRHVADVEGVVEAADGQLAPAEGVAQQARAVGLTRKPGHGLSPPTIPGSSGIPTRRTARSRSARRSLRRRCIEPRADRRGSFSGIGPGRCGAPHGSEHRRPARPPDLDVDRRRRIGRLVVRAFAMQHRHAAARVRVGSLLDVAA